MESSTKQSKKINTDFIVFFKKGEEKTLSNTFYLILKPEKDTIKENYRPIYIMSIDTKTLNEKLANKIYGHYRRIIYYFQAACIPGIQDCLHN